MNSKKSACRSATAILCSFLIAGGDSPSFAQTANPATEASAKIPNEKLDSLVAPIALYPDSLLGQVLVASTYPLEIVELGQWLEKHKSLKPEELTQAVEKQSWDPSVQAMAAFPDVVKNMNENIKWTDELGNAFLAQQSDVMDAVQRMRLKAQNSGKLESTAQQRVDTQTVDNRSVVVIEPASPEVVYVPTYDPVAVWGAPMYYPYPPIYYPPGYVAASAISFGIGVAIGAAWGGGGWGWNCGWRGNNITINNNNAFVNHYNRVNGGNRYAGNGSSWRHNPQHRGGAPYGDRATAQRFNGAARGDNSRQNAARQNMGGLGGGKGSASRLSGGNGAGGNAWGGRGPGPGGNGAAGIGSGGRGPGAGSGIGSANRSSGGVSPGAGGAMGGDRIGNRQTSRPSGGAFGGGGMSGAGARQSSQRGRSSMGGGFGGGGMRGGGGTRGGGRRR